MSNATLARITALRMRLSDLRAFTPEWERLNAELIRLMQTSR